MAYESLARESLGNVNGDYVTATGTSTVLVQLLEALTYAVLDVASAIREQTTEATYRG